MCESQEVLDLLKQAKWDCTRKVFLKVQVNEQLRYMAKKYRGKFSIENGKFCTVGRYLVEPHYRGIYKIIHKYDMCPKDASTVETFLKQIVSCDSSKCSNYDSCEEKIKARETATSKLIKMYRNIATKWIVGSVRLDNQHHDQLWRDVDWGIYHAIYYFDFRKKVKFSTLVSPWIKCMVVDFYNDIRSGKTAKSKNRLLFGCDMDLKSLDDNFVSESNIKFKNIKRKTIKRIVYDFDKFVGNQRLIMQLLYDENFNPDEVVPKFHDNLLKIQVDRKKDEYDAIADTLGLNVDLVKSIEKTCLKKFDVESEVITVGILEKVQVNNEK
jgi:hypothetical protein